jgi:hypothetical protein
VAAVRRCAAGGLVGGWEAGVSVVDSFIFGSVFFAVAVLFYHLVAAATTYLHTRRVLKLYAEYWGLKPERFESNGSFHRRIMQRIRAAIE